MEKPRPSTLARMAICSGNFFNTNLEDLAGMDSFPEEWE